ncbi:L-threonylcarbamoyladenylate synthase [Aggregatilineales bacterium SYSU G02658]
MTDPVSTTLLLTVDPTAPEPATMTRAAQVILSGGLVAFPTETVYGLGAHALNAEAVARIFRAKQRPSTDPLIVHIADLADLPPLVDAIPPAVADLAVRFWPGPLTLVLPRSARVPDLVTAGQPTVAVRMPSHPVAQALIRAANAPIAAPSANRFSRPSPTTADHVLADLAGRVDVVLDGGPATIGVESTILDLTSDPPAVLRPGGVPVEALRALLPDLTLRTLTMTEGQTAPAPGTLLKHYSPEAELILFSGSPNAVSARMARHAAEQIARGAAVAALVIGHAPLDLPAGVTVVSLGADDGEAANRLFAVLRQLERSTDVILARAPAQVGLGLALWDRLWRAAEGRVVQVE